MSRSLPPIFRRSVATATSVALTIGAAAAIAAGVAQHAAAAAAVPVATKPAVVGGIRGIASGAGTRTDLATSGAIGGVVNGPFGPAPDRMCVVAVGRGGAAAGVTAQGGRYLITGLAPGSYSVGYRDCGRPSRYLNEWYGGSLRPGGAARVLVMPGRPTWLSPLTLHPARASMLRAAAKAAALRNAGARPDAESRPSISGVVKNAAGKGLSRVCVSASHETPTSSYGVATFTSRSGHYSLPNLKVGTWTVAFATGCGGAKYAPQWWNHANSAAKATPIHLRKGNHVTGINARLVVGGVITGTVRAGRASGRGLGGVCVFADGSGRAAGITQQAVSHPDGSYRIAGLGTGSYRLQFFPECGVKGSWLDRSLKTAVAVTDGKTTAAVNTFLVPAAEISGMVTAAKGGRPLPGICMFALPVVRGQGEVALVGIEQTGKNGGYTITGLRRGKYVVNFSGGCGNKGSYAPQYYNGQPDAAAASPISLKTGQHATGIDASMQPGGTITGRVTDRAGRALRAICVVATSAQDAGDVDASPEGLLLSAFPVFIDLAVTRSTGGYRLANLVPGSYEVSFTSGCGNNAIAYAGQWFAPQGGNTPTWLSVRPGLVTSGIGTVLRRGGSITGVVTGPAGKPVRGICPFPVARSGQPPAAGEVVGSLSATRTNGSYKIRGLAAGKYAVGFASCGPQKYAVSWYKGSGSIRTARQVVVTDGQDSSGINQTVRAGQAVSGTVRSGVSGLSVKSACVAAVDSGGFADRFTATNKVGGYSLRHLAAGHYSLDTFGCGSPPELANVRSDIQVKNASQAGVNVTMPLSGTVSGVNAGGSPATLRAGICVLATPQTGSGMAGVTMSRLGGKYVLTDLASGTYLIKFSSLCPGGSGGFTSQWFSEQSSQAQATPVTVSAGSTHGGVGATLAAVGEIAGTVEVSGTPAAGVCVIAYPAAGHQAPAVAETGPSGKYQIGGLDAGSYDVEFAAGCGTAAYVTQWFNGAVNKSAATPVAVTAGSVTQSVDAH